MTIVDYWSNPVTPAVSPVVGYQGDISEFPHDIYSFIMSTIRHEDQDDIALVWRWVQPMQEFWESQYNQILTIPSLLSPEDCPEVYLPRLRKQIGITDDVSYLWGDLSVLEQRKLIKFFVRFLKYRATPFGINEMIETMTGIPIDVYNYFSYRSLLSGNVNALYEQEDLEMALGREDDASDFHLLSEAGILVGATPDTVEVLTSSGESYYKFVLDGMVELSEEQTIPQYMKPILVYIKHRGTDDGEHSNIFFDGSNYVAYTSLGFIFSQPPSQPSTTPSDFRVSFESDEYVSDILIEDDVTINHDVVQALARFSRPQSERIYIRYYNLIEQFTDFDKWDEISGTATFSEDNANVALIDAVEDTVIQCNLDGSESWESYCVHIKMQQSIAEKYTIIRYMVQGTGDYYYLKVTPATPPNIPQGTWELHSVESTVDVIMAAGELEWFDLNVDYMWRIESVTSERPGGNVQVTRIYQDENLLATNVENPPSWSTPKGTIEIVAEIDNEVTISRVLAHPIPMEFDYVGP